ncbi:MAG: hypothetical protein DHS20C18_27360 [Saprospiraceae bacterium]|nr:MAG: hypothetical protein DHS20C18_27360 [Saprospiraceae bacterium]
MKDYITIATFHNSYQLDLVKSQLQAEDIPFFVRDERILQVDPMESFAYGGAKLQVPPSHLETVRKMLEEAGILSAEHDRIKTLGILQPIDRLAAQMPLIRVFSAETRVFLLLSSLLILLFLVLVFVLI